MVKTHDDIENSIEINSANLRQLGGRINFIDNKITNLRSLNFTGNGTRNNYETRIRISDRKAIKELVTEFDALFHNEDYLEKELIEGEEGTVC
ncbi:hypothetical protein KCTC52924_02679 [Arenibacter antarcticus]